MPTQQQFIQLWWEVTPWWGKLLGLLTIIAIVNIAICLPLITHYLSKILQNMKHNKPKPPSAETEPETVKSAKTASQLLAENEARYGPKA